MLGSKKQSTLLHASQNIIQYQWTGLGDYVVELVYIRTIKNTCHLIYARIRGGKKTNTPPSMYYTNGNDQIIGPKLSWYPTNTTNTPSHLKTENIYKRW